MADLLTPTVQTGSAEALAKLETDVEAALADSSLLPAEIESALQALLAQLTSDADSEALSGEEQLASVAPEIAVFTQALEQAITDAKAATPAGILAAQNLATGVITKEQFAATI